jgi:6-methylpretetramide 4-monooxygenase / 4-hydroxy-6-methylpretetramide 12a-monooxygenase
VAWVSPFRMHHRVSSRFAGQRRFLLGDAGHLSSPFGGEGLNSGLHDAHNIAWKLALELRGRARPALLESYAPERLAADKHVVEVSDQIHQMVRDAIESARTGIAAEPPPDDQQDAIIRSRTMLDVTYAGTALVGEHVGPGREVSATLAPGERYPERASLPGTAHHLLLFGEFDAASVERLRQRWHGLVEVRPDAGDPTAAGLADSGGLLIRPDGHIAFRASPADAAGLEALDAHLDSYLIPRWAGSPSPGSTT